MNPPCPFFMSQCFPSCNRCDKPSLDHRKAHLKESASRGHKGGKRGTKRYASPYSPLYECKKGGVAEVRRDMERRKSVKRDSTAHFEERELPYRITSPLQVSNPASAEITLSPDELDILEMLAITGEDKTIAGRL